MEHQVSISDGNGMAKRDKALRRVSQQDIAREANVSRVTGSLVLSGKDQTSEETRRRVLEVAERLRYRPNLLVQGMQTGRSGVIGLIVPVGMHFQGQIVHGIHDEVIKSDFVPIEWLANPVPEAKSQELEQIHRLVDRRVDGMIIWPADASVPDVHFHEIWERQIPLVTVDRETTTHADHVGTDEELGGRLVAEHLLSLGHKHTLHVTYPHRTGSMIRRRESFIAAMKEAGGDCEVIEASQEQMLTLIPKALKGTKKPTAIFAATDPIAMRVYSAVMSAGLRIPDDVSVVGYADFPFSRDLWPPMTSVKQDPYLIGRTAARILLDRVLERITTTKPQRVHIKPELMVRKSTGPANLR